MAFIEQNYFGKYGKEAMGAVWTSVAFWGSTAEYAAKKTEPTFAIAKEVFWYGVRKRTQRFSTQYIRPIRSWLK